MVDLVPDIIKSTVARTGPPGSAGNQIFSGSGPPADPYPDAYDGDWYLDTVTGDLYELDGPVSPTGGSSAIAALSARIDVLEATVLPPSSAIASSLYYGPLSTLDGWAGPLIEQLAVADYLYAVPFDCPATVAFNQVGVEVSTAVAGGTMRMGLYASGADGMPAALAYEWGTVDCSVTNWRSIPITTTIARGNYWLAGARNATIGIKAIPVTAGMTAKMGYFGTDGTSPRSSVFRTLTPGFTTLPATFGAATTTSVKIAAFQLRAA